MKSASAAVPRDEMVLLLDGEAGEPTLLLRRRPGVRAPVLYVHGATFPSGLSVAYRFAGRSWMDDLAARGFDVWAFDFAGYGGSDRPSAMHDERTGPHIGRAEEAASQVARVVRHIVLATGQPRVSVVAHSWGSMPAGLCASRHPEHVARLCLFGPIAQRDTPDGPGPASAGAWRLVSVAEQLARFTADVPYGHPPVLIEPELREWGPTYLASDPEAAKRTPPAVKIPNGPAADILAAWSGKLAWRPEEVRCPALIVRGEWDSVSTDRDANWLLPRLGGPIRQDVRIARGTHLMHLEHSRDALFATVGEFLRGQP